MDIQYLPVSWTQYHDCARKLAASILSHSPEVNQIVAISRGGLTLGHLLSDFLRIPIATITIQSYTDIQSRGEIRITEELSADIGGKNVLLVDDVSDSGKTLRRAVSYLADFKPSDVTTVTMYYKPKSEFRPDFFAEETTRWILFPYEPTEMILAITRSFMKEGKTKNEIQEFLVSLGYTDEQIKFVRRWHLKEDV